MKRILLFLVTMAYALVAGAAEKGCIDLGRNPFGDRDVMPALVTLVGAEKAQVFADLMATTQGESIIITPDMKFNMEFGNYKLLRGVCVKGAEQATAYAHPVTGEVLVIPAKCRNPSLLVNYRAEVATQVVPPAPVTPPEAPPAEVAPAPAEVAPPSSVSAFDPPRRIEIEAGAGIGVWSNNLAEGKWGYVEGLLWNEVGGGMSIGGGVYGNTGSGESKVSDYSWHENAFGVQAGIKQSYKTEEGQSAQWQIKARLLQERIHGGSPTSGYAMSQQNMKAGVYLENMKRINAECIAGWNAEGWVSFKESIKSTWAGDKPQSRDQAQANYVQECRINKLWSWRLSTGLSFTSWDHQAWAGLGVELKYDFTNKVVIAFGPNLKVPLGVSSVYAGRSVADLATLGFGIRIEYGDKWREDDANRRVGEIVEINPATGAPITAVPATQVVGTAPAVGSPVAVPAVPATQAVSKGSDPCFTCDNRPGSWHTLE
ncbi:MAG: hypothetical protein WAU28_02215 [Candidatus Moraniibacteriota bacterium]